MTGAKLSTVNVTTGRIRGVQVDAFNYAEEGEFQFLQGSNGPAYDGRLYGQPWGFELEDIAFDSVHLWHGERDQFVPVSIARSMAKAIPNCQARFYPNDTHRSIGYNHLEEFMASLLS